MSRRTIFRNISPDSDEARQAALEGEVPELGSDFFQRGRIRIGKMVLREAQGTLTKRGRPPIGSGPKVQQSLRLSPEVLEHFRATGPGWQVRIDEVLKRHVKLVSEMKRRMGEAQAAESKVAEEQSDYVVAAPAPREGVAPAAQQARRPMLRRPWTKPAVRPMSAGDAEAGGGRRDSAALAS